MFEKNTIFALFSNDIRGREGVIKGGVFKKIFDTAKFLTVFFTKYLSTFQIPNMTGCNSNCRMRSQYQKIPLRLIIHYSPDINCQVLFQKIRKNL